MSEHSADYVAPTEKHYSWCATCEERECAYPELRHGLYCTDCGELWPCETSRALATLARVREVEVSIRLAAAEPERTYSAAGWRQRLYMAGSELREVLDPTPVIASEGSES